MVRLKYPVGIQTFSEIIEKGYAYVDKTHFIPKLIEHGKYLFLSRPRRFGKSLLLSTLEAYFEGQRELFKNLALYDADIDWTPSPVLHLDFNSGLYDEPDGLLLRLHSLLEKYEKDYGLEVGKRERLEIPGRFERLIHRIYDKTGRQLVVLIDEYDKPLLAVEENAAVYEEHQTLLKSLYSNLKTMDSCIRFVLITGVARFSKVSIFSDLNHLNDISLIDDFADICGWSESELLNNFKVGIGTLAERLEEDFDTTLSRMREYYDGYLFAPGGTRLYNPFSVLCALSNKVIDPYWFSTGSPYFLVKRVKNLGIYPPDINGLKCTRDALASIGINDTDPIPLMFQTGYLTIDSYNPDNRIFRLRFPNREVEIGFYNDLLPAYLPEINHPYTPFSFINFSEDLHEGRPEDFMKRLATLFKNLPGEDHKESTYRAITFLISILCSSISLAEHHGYLGRSDIEVITRNYIYIFEFKYNESVEAAIAQIYSRDYHGRYALDSRRIYLIGANYCNAKTSRGLSYEIIPLN